MLDGTNFKLISNVYPNGNDYCVEIECKTCNNISKKEPSRFKPDEITRCQNCDKKPRTSKYTIESLQEMLYGTNYTLVSTVYPNGDDYYVYIKCKTCNKVYKREPCRLNQDKITGCHNIFCLKRNKTNTIIIFLLFVSVCHRNTLVLNYSFSIRF